MKALLALLLIVVSYAANAQTVMFSDGNSLATDTITNTATETFTRQIPHKRASLSVQVVITKISGTVDGTAKLQGSIDGINFSDISSDTLDLTNVATQGKVWTFDHSPVLYYRVSITGSGTMAASAKAWVLARQ